MKEAPTVRLCVRHTYTRTRASGRAAPRGLRDSGSKWKKRAKNACKKIKQKEGNDNDQHYCIVQAITSTYDYRSMSSTSWVVIFNMILNFN